MVTYQIESYRKEQSSVHIFLVAEKCEPCEIFRMCDVFREVYFRKNIYINGINMGLLLQAWVEKIVHGEEIHWLSGKENVPGAVISKEGHLDYVLGN